MAHPHPVFVSHKNIKQAEYLNEKQGQRKCQYEMTNTQVAAPSDDVLDNGANQHELPNKISPNARRCQVYVHHFSKIPSGSLNQMQSNWRCGSEIHQTTYKHEFSDYYGAKIQCIKKQFDNLSLNSKTMRATSSPNGIVKPGAKPCNIIQERMSRRSNMTKIPQISSSPTARLHKTSLLKPHNKAVADKLEESYWAKWKPGQTNSNTKLPYHKTKGLYTENENVVLPYQFAAPEEKQERGDSNEAITTCVSPAKHQTLLDNMTYAEQALPQPDLRDLCASNLLVERDEISNTTEIEVEQAPENNANITENREEDKKEDSIAINNTSVSVVISKSDSECKVNILKHTDSFILTSKKQSREKPRYQQPKCIKLFKTLGYTTATPTNYIKGGTYPLKSCLRKPGFAVKPSSPLGLPGAGPSNRKPGKANRFTN